MLTTLTRTVTAAATPRPLSLTRAKVPVSWLIALLLAYWITQNLLLWRFLNFAPPWLYIAAALTGVVPCALSVCTIGKRRSGGPSVATLAICGAAALIVLVLGGEGRFFYSNADWQVRDAVLRDLIVYPWPFVYDVAGTQLVLRLPIAMFLVPALAGKVAGPTTADLALLAQNWLHLTILLSLGSLLFNGVRTRAIALLIILLFSGMDVIGQGLIAHRSIIEHGEGWAGIQFSSHITQAFWVPQHAFAGWFGALFFLLWKNGRIPLGVFLAAIPLLLLWSPLGVMGVMPFAALAGVISLATRRIQWVDICLPAAASLISIPVLLYLGAAGGSVGFHFVGQDPVNYIIFEALEVAPYLAAAAFVWRHDASERVATLLIVGILLIAPFIQIGESVDFGMRATITALALLSVLVVRFLTSEAGHSSPFLRAVVVTTLLIGSFTPLLELSRAFRFEPSPRVHCSLYTAWDQIVDLAITTKATYFAPRETLLGLIRPPAPTLVRPALDPAICWPRAWKTPIHA